VSRRLPGAALAVSVLTLLYAAFGAWIGAGYDTGRDVAAAWQIVHDGARPLAGPLFAGQVHLGPAWFYVLAAPLAIAPGWLAPALMAAALAALQLPLAYASGTRLADRRLGVFWACALLLPGWASFEHVGFSSTNLVRTCVLATLYCLVRTQQTPRARWWLLAGVAAALAIHAHPSAAWLAPVVMVVALARPGPVAHVVRDRVAAIALALAGLVLPFAPVLAAPQALVATVSATAAANLDVANLARLPELFVSIVWSGPYAIFGALYGHDDLIGRLAAIVAAIVGAIGAVSGIAAALRGDRAAQIGLVLTLASAAFVALIRPVTPLYMAYTVIACLALLVAAGWRTLARAVAGRPGRIVGGTFEVLAVCAWLAVGLGQVDAMARGGGRIDSPLLANITAARAKPSPLPDVWLPAKDVDVLGRALCAAPGPVYGALPYLLDVHYALPVRIRCPDAFAAFDTRGTGTSARVALAHERWRELGATPPQRIGNLGIAPVTQLIAAPASRALPRDATYPPHGYVEGPVLGVDYAFDLPAGQVVVASNPRVGWMPAWETSARCNGAPASLVTADVVTRVYACAALAEPARWEVSARAADPAAIEFVALDPAARPPSR